MKSIACALSIMTVVASGSTFASNLCNAAGQVSLLCSTQDKTYAFEITKDRDSLGLGISDIAFCTSSYLKLDGEEVNGAFGTPVAADGPMAYTQSVSSSLGVRAANPATKKIVVPETVAGFQLRNAVKGIAKGHLFVYLKQDSSSKKTQQSQLADLYLYDGEGKQVGYQRLSCADN